MEGGEGSGYTRDHWNWAAIENIIKTHCNKLRSVFWGNNFRKNKDKTKITEGLSFDCLVRSINNWLSSGGVEYASVMFNSPLAKKFFNILWDICQTIVCFNLLRDPQGGKCKEKVLGDSFALSPSWAEANTTPENVSLTHGCISVSQTQENGWHWTAKTGNSLDLRG